jgi:hypothetical protein
VNLNQGFEPQNMEEVKEVKQETPSAPIQDVYITLLFYMFSCNIFATLAGIFLAAIPYYDYFGLTATREGALIFGASSIIFYIGFYLCLVYRQTEIAIAFAGCWWVSFSLFIGCVSALIYNIALIQWLLISWTQSLIMIVYIKTTKIEPYITIASLVTATLAIWIISVYGFIVENDWAMSVVILLFGFALAVYNAWQIKHVKGRYDLSWEQSVLVCAHYYCPFL